MLALRRKEKRTRRRSRWAGTLGVGLALSGGFGVAWAGQSSVSSGSDEKKPVLITADNLDYNQTTGGVVARGNVEISQESRVLLADEVHYNERTQTVVASGNVSLLEPDGTVLFATYMKLTDEMKAGVINSIRVLMIDNARMAGRQGTREGGQTTSLERAVYSPCNLCEDDPARAPLWQIKAYRVVHDQVAKEIQYQDAFVEFFGVPVLYSPYLSHPDPTVKRKSGFMMPSIGNSSELGTRVSIPYYWAISPERDITITPIITSEQGMVLKGDYRALTDRGSYNLSGSITYADLYDSDTGSTSREGWRGHIFGAGKFVIGNNSRWGFALQRASDETYLQRYSFQSFDRLRSQVYAESFLGDSYFTVNAYWFQSLRATDDSRATPLVAPWTTYNFVGRPDRLGGRTFVNADALVLNREQGISSRRLSLRSEWQRPFISQFGEVYTLTLGLKGDGYSTDGIVDTNGDGPNNLAGRFLPEGSLEWRLPFVRSLGTWRQTLEPLASVTVSPYGGNPVGIPNEDSTAVAFDTGSLLQSSRYAGLDRIESGPRAMAGLRTGLYASGGGSGSFMFGQAFRMKRDDGFSDQSGLSGTRSDYVGRIDLLPTNYFDITQRFRLDVDDLSLNENEVVASLGPSRIKFNIGYLKAKGDPTDASLPDREEINTRIGLRLDEYWSVSGTIRRNLLDRGQTISQGASLSYRDECLIASVLFNQRFTRDRDIAPSTSINFVVQLLNLG